MQYYINKYCILICSSDYMEDSMATLTLRVSDETREELEALAQSKGTTVSALLRDQIDQLLGRDVEMRRGDVPQSLTMTERLLLANQSRILAALDPDEADYYARRSETLEEGYAGEYGDVFAAVGPELTRTECALVWDLLDMFRVLSASIEALSPADRAVLGEERIDRLQFQGFDISDELEGRLLSYVQYLVRGRRWSEVGPRLEEIGDDGNSHHRCLPFYRLLLDTYRPIITARAKSRGYSLDAYRLDLEELIELAEVSFR